MKLVAGGVLAMAPATVILGDKGPEAVIPIDRDRPSGSVFAPRPDAPKPLTDEQRSDGAFNVRISGPGPGAWQFSATDADTGEELWVSRAVVEIPQDGLAKLRLWVWACRPDTRDGAGEGAYVETDPKTGRVVEECLEFELIGGIDVYGAAITPVRVLKWPQERKDKLIRRMPRSERLSRRNAKKGTE